jgi:hypothetical protein
MAKALKESEAPEGSGSDGSDSGDGGDPPNPHLANTLHLSTTFKGNVVGDLGFDPIAGAELTEAIAARVDHLYATGVFGPHDGLTPAARRGWALRTLITDGTQPTSLRGKPRPSISLLLDQRTASGAPIDDIDDLLARRCELTDGTPVPLRTAQRLLCDCTITAIVRKTLADGHIEIIGITDHQRTATPRQRTALAQRDGGCIFPGCHTPPERCHAHHIHHHEHGGPTLTHNLALVCSYHHHLIHEGNWQLTRHPHTGQLHLTKPDGTPVPLIPQGHKAPAPPPAAAGDPARPAHLHEPRPGEPPPS